MDKVSLIKSFNLCSKVMQASPKGRHCYRKYHGQSFNIEKETISGQIRHYVQRTMLRWLVSRIHMCFDSPWVFLLRAKEFLLFQFFVELQIFLYFTTEGCFRKYVTLILQPSRSLTFLIISVIHIAKPDYGRLNWDPKTLNISLD